MKLSEGQVIAGRYEINNILGTGGMAVVYRALDTKLDRYVALKVLREELAANKDFVKRFPVEAMAAAALSHPNIVNIFDYGQEDEIYYIVLEYLDGSNLKELIDSHAPFDNEAVLGMALQIADGLAAAHKAGIIHRDIKPQNIMVTANSNAKVADFGIARVAKDGTITTGDSMGSVQYFSPEQARGGYIDHKTDIYSLGIVMYEMATGCLPFDGENAVAVALQHINDPLPDMMEYNPNISDSVFDIILKATNKTASMRYDTIDEMADDLNQALADASTTLIRIEIENDHDTDYSEYPNENDSYDDEYNNEDDFDSELQDEEATYDKKGDRMAILLGIGVALIFSLLILLGSCSVYNRLRTVRITPPNVIGMTYDDAWEVARDYGLTIALEDPIFHNDIEEGLIIYQSPTTDHNNMAPGDAIRVTISLGPSHYMMPDIIGMHVDEAKELLGESDNILVWEQVHESGVGTIFDQSPEPGTPIGEGTMFVLYVSQGMDDQSDSNYVHVPNLIGVTQEEALNLLRDAYLLTGVILQDESTTFARGLVFRQNPQPGEVVEIDSLVSFTISTGAELPPTPAPTPEPSYYEEYNHDDPYETDDPDDINGDDPDSPDTTPEPGEDDSYNQPEPVSRNLTIPLWSIADDAETVHIRVYRQPAGGTRTRVANAPVSVDAFPQIMAVQGNGLVYFHVYEVVDGEAHFIRMYEINFDE